MQVLFKPAEVEVEVSNQPLGGPTHTQREREGERGSTIAQDSETRRESGSFCLCTCRHYYHLLGTHYSPFQHVNLAQVVTRNYVRTYGKK